MDPISQGVLGAAVAEVATKRQHIKTAAFCGALGGIAPDLDIFIRSSTDPLLRIEYHRHFTHSLAFVPIGGLIIAFFIWLVFYRNKEPSFKLIYAFTTLGFATHGLLDACTSYGTRLYWPFSDFRVSWNIISIIDPVYTLTLLVFCGLSLWRKSVRLMQVGLVLSLCYMGFCYLKHEKVEDFVRQLAQQRGHAVERVLLNPTIGNNILWRTIYQSGGKYYVDAVYYPIFGEPLVQKGDSVPVVDKHTVFPELPPESQQRKDIERFAYFSQDFIYLHPEHENVIADLRYGTLPYDIKSMWGVIVNPEQPEAHVQWANFRKVNSRNLDEFWLMLNGNLIKK